MDEIILGVQRLKKRAERDIRQTDINSLSVNKKLNVARNICGSQFGTVWT